MVESAGSDGKTAGRLRGVVVVKSAGSDGKTAGRQGRRDVESRSVRRLSTSKLCTIKN